MRHYLDHLHSKEPHQKREFAAHAAAVLTGIVALVWLSTLGARLVGGTPQTTTAASTDASSLVAATAQAGAAFQSQVQSYDQNQSQNAAAQNIDQSATNNSGLYAATTTDTSNTGGATVIGTPDNPATTLSQ